MDIKTIALKNSGYVTCRSCFYTCNDVLPEKRYEFTSGINYLRGEIDSGIWAVSVLLSAVPFIKKGDYSLFDPLTVEVNGESFNHSFYQYSCYMDESNPMFQSNQTVRQMVEKAVSMNNNPIHPNEICELFQMTPFRFDRPISQVGNEVFKAMSAIAYLENKKVFCFPWMSRMRFDGLHENMTDLLQILKKLDRIVVLPIGE